MPQERLSVRKISEVLRLSWECGLSKRATARSCHISHSTVCEYLARAKAAGLSWPLPKELTEEQLVQQLYPEKVEEAAGTNKRLPVWDEVHRELQKRGVTLRLLWVEYREQFPDGYGRSQFCELYRLWAQKLNPPMRMVHKAGEKLYVDYAGDTVPIIDPQTGEVSKAHIFVAVLGASSYTYAEAQRDQTLPNWIGGHIRAFAFLGGLPQIVVPDNLKQGVQKPCRYEPDLNPTYREMAEHYALAIIPARPYHPRDKSKVEVGVQVVERWILARVRNRTFFSLAELNRVIQELLEELNNRPMEHLEKSRRELFEELDQPALRPLPERSYEYAVWKAARVNIDYHIEFEKHFYSVPYTLIHQEVRIRATEHMLEVFHKSSLLPVAIHPRQRALGRYTTASAHMPPNHQQAAEWNPERLLRWGEEIGPETRQLVQAILASRRCPEQAFRSCLGVLRSSSQSSYQQMETASRMALQGKILNYSGFKEILQHLPSPQPGMEIPALPTHENIRGETYYH